MGREGRWCARGDRGEGEERRVLVWSEEGALWDTEGRRV